jgi:hypothetical protein
MSTLPGQRADMLYFIVCGGLPAAEALTFVRLAQRAGWGVCHSRLRRPPGSSTRPSW